MPPVRLQTSLRIDVLRHHVAQFGDEAGIIGTLELLVSMRLQPRAIQMRRTADRELQKYIWNGKDCLLLKDLWSI